MKAFNFEFYYFLLSNDWCKVKRLVADTAFIFLSSVLSSTVSLDVDLNSGLVALLLRFKVSCLWAKDIGLDILFLSFYTFLVEATLYKLNFYPWLFTAKFLVVWGIKEFPLVLNFYVYCIFNGNIYFGLSPLLEFLGSNVALGLVSDKVIFMLFKDLKLSILSWSFFSSDWISLF